MDQAAIVVLHWLKYKLEIFFSIVLKKNIEKDSFQHSVREVRFPTRLAKSVCSKSNFPHVVLKSYVRYMFGKKILVSCAFPPSLRSGVNITRDVNLLSRTCIVMYYFQTVFI